MTELKKRILVAIIGIPFAFLVFYIGGIIFSLVIAFISSIGLWEFYKMADNKGYYANKLWGIICGLLPIIYFELPKIFKFNFFDTVGFTWFFVSVSIFLFIFVTLLINLFSKQGNSIASIGVTFTGFCYISLSFFTFVLLRNIEIIGLSLLIMIFCSIWVCDSAAFFVGRKFGKHKLMPNVSPKKSIEGAVAGLFASMLCFPLLSIWLMSDTAWYITILFGMLVGIFGQVGDLVESRLKRDAGVKDSSNIIPGHGGILDRFDSAIFAIPVIYFAIEIIKILK